MLNKYQRDQYPWLSDSTLRIKDVFIFLHNEILDFASFITSTPADKKIREGVVEKVSKVVKEVYPKAEVLVFGSCATNLNLPHSDIDLLVYYP